MRLQTNKHDFQNRSSIRRLGDKESGQGREKASGGPRECDAAEFLDQERKLSRKREGQSFKGQPPMDRIFSEEQRLFQDMVGIVAEARQKGASAREMAESLRSDLKAIWDQGFYEGQAGRDLLDAVNRPDRHDNYYRRSDTIVVRQPGEKKGQEVEAAELLSQQGLALMSRQQRWYALGQQLEGHSPNKDHLPQEGSLIDQLEKGEITTKNAAVRIESILQRDYSPLSAEAFEGTPQQASLGFLKGVFGRENFQAALRPERTIKALQDQVGGFYIDIPKGQDGKPVSTSEAVRESILNGEELPEGVTVSQGLHLKDRTLALVDSLQSWVGGLWHRSP